jgi:diguanylate cyclase (GGDEF)-like protein
MRLKPESLTGKVILPVILIIVVSLGLVSALLNHQINDATVRLNTAFLAQKTKNSFHFCERAVGELMVSTSIGEPAAVAAQKEITISEIENYLISEDLDGFVARDGEILFATLPLENLFFDEDRGRIEIVTPAGFYLGYYFHFPMWNWYVGTLLHEKPYWEAKRTSQTFLATTIAIYLILLGVVFLLLRVNLQQPIAIILNELRTRGRIGHRSGCREIDSLSEAINDALSRKEHAHRQLQVAEAEKISLEVKAMTDGLTGLFNRRKLNLALEAEIARAFRHRTGFAMIMFDIDHFKVINDTRGHRLGDEVLQALALLIAGTIRKEDILARWGGEEFAILSPCANLEQGRQLAERIRRVVEDHDIAGVAVTISLGVAHYEEGDDGDDLTRRADEALYRAKQNGRNRVEVCHANPGRKVMPLQA